MAHFFITLTLPFPLIVLWILQRITQRFGEIVPSCLSKFAFAWIINLSQEWQRRQDFSLCFLCFCVTGVIGIILLHNTHAFPGIWMFASCSHGHSLLFWFQGLPAVLQTVLLWWWVKNAITTFFKTGGGKSAECCYSPFIYSFVSFAH